MKQNTSRRSFLRNSAIATTGLALLSSTQTVSAFTEFDSPFSGYNPYIDEKTDLRSYLSNEESIEINGTIYDVSGENTLAGALVEVWHLSPNSLKYRHRGKTTTNDKGNYQFITDKPNREAGKTPRVYFKVTHGDRSYFTELLIGITGAHITGKHWEENKLNDERLFPTTQKQLDKTIINFNITN
ncbi:twin-arginine translocation signal domain-containing protein [Jejudonia soesokkakensis]|uniref:Twin-arginine translocation signal domain-containing protein n=1 Tax=Jejudonia soesokkakensis TaxID=1323432 RepID=A0ABW2MX72_9FLAO